MCCNARIIKKFNWFLSIIKFLFFKVCIDKFFSYSDITVYKKA